MGVGCNAENKFLEVHLKAEKLYQKLRRVYYENKGFDLMGAPWHIDDANGYAHIDTVAQNGLFGVMLTTWHRMDYRTPNILNFARYFGCAMATWSSILEKGR